MAEHLQAAPGPDVPLLALESQNLGGTPSGRDWVPLVQAVSWELPCDFEATASDRVDQLNGRLVVPIYGHDFRLDR